ncbi:hypothetical protein [Polynucleobacter sp. Fuers-14]|uniref:hypothetical protein n=1 Tax=Polynucleobacter sp. Fuers-14 TaxID=1758364 RepID=UPI001C0CE0DC|nr:hypothetical protein [Polynucleobacter sp. Fuers-14]
MEMMIKAENKYKLVIAELMRAHLDGGRPTKVYYVYETNANGLIVQKHGVDSAGTPFKSKEAAKQWMGLKILERDLRSQFK